MKIIFILFQIVIFFVPLNHQNFDSNWKWKKIIPLVSTCEDVKKILDVNDCVVPDSDYKFSNCVITVTFSKGENKKKVEKGTVLELGISLKELIKLEEYEKDLTDYESFIVSDTPDYQRLVNRTKGVELLVTKDKFIQYILIYPPEKRK